MSYLERIDDYLNSLEDIASFLKDIKKEVLDIPDLQAEMDLDPEEERTDSKILELLMTNFWPHAVPPHLVCNEESDEEKLERAKNILDLMIEANLDGLKFLDFGCGEGHVARTAVGEGVVLSVGYDIKPNAGWKSEDKLLFTDNFEAIQEKAPYDIILLFDVLDHVENEKPEEVLKKLKGLLSKHGKVFLRCHPWCSRHGTHLYKTINKAFLHLIFTEYKLQALEYSGVPTVKVIDPAIVYPRWIRSAGFRITQQYTTTEKLEDFFAQSEIISKRIQRHWRRSLDRDLREGFKFPKNQLEVQFMDFILEQ